MKKTRIAFCLRDMQLGGVESVLIRTLDCLKQDKNLDLTVVTFVELTEPLYADWFEKNKSVKRIVLYPSKIFGTRMPRFFLWRVIKHVGRDIYRFARRTFVVPDLLADIDTFVDYHDFGFAKELQKIKASKKIAWFHSSINVFIKRKFNRRLQIYDKIVVLTDDCANDLKKICSCGSDKFMRIYNPINFDNIRLQAKEKISMVDKYFCCVSRMSYDKDIKTLLDAFNLFWQSCKDIKLVLVGGGDKIDIFKKYAMNLKSYKNILFVGAQKNPYVYMANSVANILSSRGEGLPTVLIESSVVGGVNISANCKYGPREILLNGRGGLLFQPGDVNGLAQCMDVIYNHKVDVRSMIAESSNALKRFESDTIIKQIKSLIV